MTCELTKRTKPIVNFETSDGIYLQTPFNVAIRSTLVRMLLEDCVEDSEHETVDVPLPKVNAATLRKMLEYFDHYKDTPIPADEHTVKNSPRRTSNDINDWDRSFIDIEQSLLFELITAANYMDCKPLLDLGCKTIANLLTGKSTDEIRTIFSITNDFTSEEEEAARNQFLTNIEE